MKKTLFIGGLLSASIAFHSASWHGVLPRYIELTKEASEKHSHIKFSLSGIRDGDTAFLCKKDLSLPYNCLKISEFSDGVTYYHLPILDAINEKDEGPEFFGMLKAGKKTYISNSHEINQDDLLNLFGSIIEDELKPRSKFGYSFSRHNDLMVIGAIDANDYGEVFIYRKKGESDWQLEQKIENPIKLDSSEDFGYKVLLVSDDELLVSSANTSYSETNSGLVFYFKKKSGVWVEEQRIEQQNPQALDYFGVDMVKFDDETLLISRDGQVLTFKKESGTWVQVDNLFEIDNKGRYSESRGLGTTLAISPSGKTIIAAGSNYTAVIDGSSEKYVGAAAFIERQEDGAYIQSQLIMSASPATYDYFGKSAYFYRDDIALIGAQGRDFPTTSSGNVFVYQKQGEDWVLIQEINSGSRIYNEQFGSFITGDSKGNVFIAAPFTELEDMTHGAIYHFVFDDENFKFIKKNKIHSKNKIYAEKYMYNKGVNMLVYDNTLFVSFDNDHLGSGVDMIEISKWLTN